MPRFVPFTAQTRMSGVDVDGSSIRKGAVDAILTAVTRIGARRDRGGAVQALQPASAPKPCARSRPSPTRSPRRAARRWRWPATGALLGVIHLKDIVKGGIRERFAELRRMGIRTVMITGDNPLTAAAIAAEAGVDDFLAQATPEDKLKLIRDEQAKGKLVAMCGDGTNDAPALAQADVGVAMNTGTMAAREAGNMVDLDSDPDQADRDRRDRQAAADDARRADHVLDRQRRGQVFRDHPGDVRRHLPAAAGAQHHASRDARRARSCRRSSSTR